MNRLIAYALGIVGSLSSLQVQAKPPVALEPSSQWHVVYDDDNCRLARVFGEGDSKVFLAFDKTSPISKLKPTISGPPVRQLIGRTMGITAAFGENEKLIPVRLALAGTIGPDKQPMLILSPLDLLNRRSDESDGGNGKIDLTPPTAEQLSRIRHFKVARNDRELALHLGPLSQALAALDVCTADLVKTWGLDPAQQAALRQRPTPIGSPNDWVKSADYPTAALAGGKSANIGFRLMVDASGKPTSCKIQKATNSPEFIEHTCRVLMKWAKFTPALDAQGSPSQSYYVNTVSWLAGQ